MPITRSLTEELRPSEENIREADRCTKSLRPILIEPRHLPVEKIADEHQAEGRHAARWPLARQDGGKIA